MIAHIFLLLSGRFHHRIVPHISMHNVASFSGTLACNSSSCDNNGTCLYVGGEFEFICECQEGFVGDRCQHQGMVTL